MKRVLLVLFAASIGCGASIPGSTTSTTPVSVSEALQALPSAESLTVGTPSMPTRSSVHAYCHSQPSTPGQLCTRGDRPYEAMVEALAGKVSSGITHWVGVLNDLLASAGAPCAGDPCTVELPAKTSGAITWTTTITKGTVNGSVQYGYVLAGKDTGSGTSATVVTAAIQPGGTAGVGKGTLVIDYDAEKALGLGGDRRWEHETGKVTVTYDNTAGLSLSIVADKGQDASGDPRSASVSLTFQQGASGEGGELAVVIKYGASDEVDVTACWDATGEGRSDVKVQGEAVTCPQSAAQAASASTVTREVVECWGPASACYTLQYFSASRSGGTRDVSFTYPVGATSDACTVPACPGGSTVGGGGGGGSDTGGGGGGGGGGSDTGGGGGGRSL